MVLASHLVRGVLYDPTVYTADCLGSVWLIPLNFMLELASQALTEISHL